MRLHRLRVQAFGPFAGVEEVDVDRLSEHGLFLLHGPTGAGKTSVLDAVCFALYGQVPGTRQTGRLRSDHAEPGLAPEVVCELTAGGRRFEVTRSPSWSRPKKRGDGTTTEQARTVLREKVDGEWVARSSRNDEASQLLTDVLGMGMGQFTKVVLLPQGEFAAFLRAPADDRRALLQRLFGTDRFSAVESWLAEARRTSARAVEAAEVGVDRLLARVHEAAAVLPPPADADRTPAPEDDGTLDRVGPPPDPVGHAQALAAWARSCLAAARVEHDAATAALTNAQARQEEARRSHGRATTLRQLRQQQHDLDADSARVRQAASALASAEAAAAVSGHVAAVAAARARRDRAADALAEAGRLAPPVPRGTELAAAGRRTREEIGRLADLLGSEQEADQAVILAHELDGTVRRLDGERGRAEEQLARLERDRAAAITQAETLREPAEAVPLLEGGLGRAREAHTAATDAARITAAVAELTAGDAAARTAGQDATARWLDVRERRLDGMAAELAAALETGEGCPVCGATEHPRPATADGAAVSAEDEDEARKVADDALERARLVASALAAARAELAVAASRSDGAPVDVTAAAVADLSRRLEQARRARTALAELTARVVALDVETTSCRAALASTGEALAIARADAGVATTRARELDDRLADARGGEPSVAARHARLTAQADAWDVLLAARGVRDAAVEAHRGVLADAQVAVRGAGFADVEAASAALLDDDLRTGLRGVLTAHQDAAAAVRARLADPELLLAAEELDARERGGVHDDGLAAVQAATDDAAAAAAAVRACVERSALLARATTTLDTLVEHVAADVAAAEPVGERHALVSELAACAEGTGGGNAMRMRLSAFVLAARLEQVAAAASVRLDRMSSGRYSLVHSDALQRGGARSGLGLQVVDAWTGAHRDTATLSGGESFMASLSLALGLADVVQAEAGGSAIETLFVDEGFGSLDEEALDEVMSTLDALREGGRAVGLVSHVAGMRPRIPSQLEVVRTRTGSHLRARAGAA